jgi:hypothetical protein
VPAAPRFGTSRWCWKARLSGTPSRAVHLLSFDLNEVQSRSVVFDPLLTFNSSALTVDDRRLNSELEAHGLRLATPWHANGCLESIWPSEEPY